MSCRVLHLVSKQRACNRQQHNNAHLLQLEPVRLMCRLRQGVRLGRVSLVATPIVTVSPSKLRACVRGSNQRQPTTSDVTPVIL